MALNIEALRRQHDDAEEIAASIIALIASFRDEYDSIPLARLVGKLNALLRVHFAVEDTILYPSMIACDDRDAAALARQFHEETGALALDFEEFARRWSAPSVIAAMFERFREEATALIGALGARIERENDQLYPAAERLPFRRAA